VDLCNRRNYRNRGELLLKHEFDGVELRLDHAADTLANVQFIWGRPVHLLTVVDGKPTMLPSTALTTRYEREEILMTLDERLLQGLAEWRPDAGRQTLNVPDDSGWTASVAADQHDALATRVWEIALRRAGTNSIDVSAWPPVP